MEAAGSGNEGSEHSSNINIEKTLLVSTDSRLCLLSFIMILL